MHHRLFSHRSLVALALPSIVSFAVATGCGGGDDDNGGTGGTGGSAGRGGAAGKAGASGNGGGAAKAGNAGRGGTSSNPTGGAAGEAGNGGRGASAGRGGTSSGTGGNAGQAGGGEGGEAGVSPNGGEAGVAQLELELVRTDLTSDQTGAAVVDTNLVNAWGLAVNPADSGARFWVSAGDAGLLTVYDASGAIEPVVVTVPSANGTDTGSPTGQVFNPNADDFMGDTFIVATEDGLIAGWQTGTDATVRADRSSSAGYKGLALVTNGANHWLAAANFHEGQVDVFDNTYTRVTTAGLFEDPNIPAGFAPFNVAELGGSVWVTYAKQDADKADDVPGVGNGFVSVFNVDGSFKQRFSSRGSLNSPWGLAVVPNTFGALNGAILVGNFGDGMIHAFQPNTGEEIGFVTDRSNHPLVIDGLWALLVGPNTAADGDLRSTVFFTAGPGGETHGVFGTLTLP
ncbi:MAG TPA: TIGR03118 family protein [Polyangiaceae bacterium]|nr:TIGR03118 family protein [Polyangiaceae bacterium]